MSYHAPKVKDVVQKTPDPLINMAEITGEAQAQRNKRGLLSTFLQGSRNRTAGTVSQAFNTTESLGRSVF